LISRVYLEVFDEDKKSLIDCNEFINFLQKSVDCNAQDKMLNVAFAIGTFFMGFTAFIWGLLIDKWGLRIVRLIIK